MSAVKKKTTLENLGANLSGLTKTVDDLAREMRGGFAGVDVKIKESEKRIVKEIDAKIDTKIDELALITKRGFDAVDERFKSVDERFDNLGKEVKDFRADNAKDHDRMDLRLGEAAWRFETANLKKRVVVLEDKAGVARKNF